MPEARNTLLQWLGANQTGRVLDGLEALAEIHGDAQLRNDCILQRGRYHHLLEQERDHLISAEQARQERAQIRKALITLIGALPGSWDAQPLAQIPASPGGDVLTVRKPIPWKAIGAVAVAVTAVLASIAAFSGYTLKDLLGGGEGENPAEVQHTAAKPGAPAPAVSFTVDCWTQQGEGPVQEFKAGEVMRLFYQTGQPCYVRAIKKRADGKLQLIDEWRVGAADAEQHRELGQGFRISAPLGYETIYFFARPEPFPPLPAGSMPGGMIHSSSPDQGLSALRAAQAGILFAEDSIRLHSYP